MKILYYSNDVMVLPPQLNYLTNRIRHSHKFNSLLVEDDGGRIRTEGPGEGSSLCQLNTQRFNQVIIDHHPLEFRFIFRIFAFPLYAMRSAIVPGHAMVCAGHAF